MHAKAKEYHHMGLTTETPPSSSEGSPMISSAISQQETVAPSVFYDCAESLPAESVCSEEEWFPAVEARDLADAESCPGTALEPAVIVGTDEGSSEHTAGQEQSDECSQSSHGTSRRSSQHAVSSEIEITLGEAADGPCIGASTTTSTALGPAVPAELETIVSNYVQVWCCDVLLWLAR
jgi:hypothetical protein